jgi:hypothetical protein
MSKDSNDRLSETSAMPTSASRRKFIGAGSAAMMGLMLARAGAQEVEKAVQGPRKNADW